MAVEQITYKNIDPRVRTTIMLGLCLAMLAACFDGTIVGTIGTVIAQDLNGLGLYSWMATAYMLCETIMIPIAGKLSDIYGRKPLFLIGLALFMAGSVVAGLSTNMEMFLVCRAVQGLGGGILIPVATAAVADLYSPRDRPRMQGLLGAIFGVGSGVGPLLGGYIAEYISWHWCFYINVPIAIVAVFLTIKKFPAPASDGEVTIDVRGISLLSLFLLDILLLIEFGGSEFEWVSATSGAMVAIAVVLMVLFVYVERRALNPILAPHLIRNRTVVMGAIFMFIFGIGMMGAMMYASMFAISVIGLTTLEAGEWSLSLVVGMMITSISSGFLLNRTGYRVWLIFGPIMCFLGLWYLSGMVVDATMAVTPNAVRDAYMGRYLLGNFVLGLGLGCMMSVIMAAVQNSSKPSEMGMTTSSVNLVRSIGATMGTAIFAMIINARLSSELASHLSEETFAVLPHDTGVLNYLTQFISQSDWATVGGILAAFSNSVDFAFLAGGTILLVLVVIGVLFKVKPPEVDEELEAAKRRIETGEASESEE
ncbi:MAG: MDR family MFS transporter [Thermoplasmata archaeon]|nr:MDR family MFS transporter [Thermoplasmata archaeon]